MDKPDETIFLLQRLISDLSRVERNHHILNTDEPENDVEHSYSVAMLCWYICYKLSLELNLEKILKYALIHDFVEVYAGDVNTYASKSDRKHKIEAEVRALSRLSEDLKSFPDMVKSLAEYELKNEEEAKFVWAVDKMQSLILGDLDNWRPYKKINISYDRFLKKHHWHLDNAPEYCKEVFSEILEYCKTTYYDNPNKKGSHKTS